MRARPPRKLLRMRNFRSSAALLLLALIGAGCTNLPYYLQSVRGQLGIWGRQHDIEAVMADPQTSRALREKLRVALQIRDFASSELGLPQNASYRSYANLERPYVVWNVFAAPEFSIQPRQWCFAFAGCVNYRGYFSRADADKFADSLAAQGYDVFVGGVPAYSLLGYFPDPVLNTFIGYPTAYLARLIFHELAHQVVYVKDDSVFNESFAVAVEQEGMRRWLDRYGTDQDRRTSALIVQRRTEFGNLIESYRERLDAVYSQHLPPQETRARKQALLGELDKDYERLKQSWGGFSGFDRWFERRANNALLASISIYTRKVPAFQALLEREGGDLGRFYAAVKRIARMDKPERTAALERLMPKTASAVSTAH
jgi:predicted aminopeptidase